MKNFFTALVVFGFFVSYSNIVSADTLYDLYSDHGSTTQTTTSNKTTKNYHKSNNTKSSTNTSSNTQYSTSSSTQSSKNVYSAVTKNYDNIIQKGGENYTSRYGNSRQRTNPISIDNPYSTLNNHYKGTTNYTTSTSNSSSSTASTPTIPSNGKVTFKKDVWGNINEYDSTGKKIGTFDINN